MNLLDEIADRAKDISDRHGFETNWENIPTKLMLVVTEIAEAMEDWRLDTPRVAYGIDGKPIGFDSEIADGLLRLLDICASLTPRIDIKKRIDEKEAYNESRSFKHGGKKA